jgi:hypothetical protein
VAGTIAIEASSADKMSKDLVAFINYLLPDIQSRICVDVVPTSFHPFHYRRQLFAIEVTPFLRGAATIRLIGR